MKRLIIKNGLAVALGLATLAGVVGCQRDDVSSGSEQTDVYRVKPKANEVAVSVRFDALTIPEDQTARALNVTTADASTGTTSYSVPKITRGSGKNQTFRATGIFYNPNITSGEKIYFTAKDAMVWTLVESNENDPTKPMRYQTSDEMVVNIDRSVLASNPTGWYFMAVVGADYDAATKTLKYDPYSNPTEKGFAYQSNGQFDLDMLLTSNWVPVNLLDKVGDAGTTPYFYPTNWNIGGKQGANTGSDIVQADGSTAEPTIKFRPRGTYFRVRVQNTAIYPMRVTDYYLTSNVVGFSATLSATDITAMTEDQIKQSGDKPKLTPVISTATVHLPVVDVRANGVAGTKGRVVAAGNSSADGATLAWGLVDPATQASIEASFRAQPTDPTTGASNPMPYFSVRASAEPSGDNLWHSMQKQADYFPLGQRVSYMSRAPVFISQVANLDRNYKDGGSQWFTVIMTSNLSNLERTTFEPLAGGGERFQRLHPWANRHDDRYNLDVVAYPDIDQATDWVITTGRFKSNTQDIDLRTGTTRFNSEVTSSASYYIPYKEQIMSYLPVPHDASSTDSVYLLEGQTKEFTARIVEPTFNVSNGDPENKINNASFILKGGSVQAVNANYGKNLATGATLPMDVNAGTSVAGMAEYNFFNYFWGTHVVYGLAFLREGDPESLVAYRYFWGISPTPASGLYENRQIGDLASLWYPSHELNPLVLGSEFTAELQALLDPRIHTPSVAQKIRTFSAYSPGRPRSGSGRAMVSIFTIGMRHIGRYHPLVRSLKDIDVVAQESFWTSAPEQVTFRIFSAVGFSDRSEPTYNRAINRNGGVYLMTQSKPANGGQKDFEYFYIGPKSWGVFSTTDADRLNQMRLDNMPLNTNYPAGNAQKAQYRGRGDERMWPVYNPNQYYVYQAYPSTGAGIPIRYMVGTASAPIN